MTPPWSRQAFKATDSQNNIGGGTWVENHLPPFFFSKMSKASKLISDAIIGADYTIVYVNNKAYPVKPPTIHRLAGAISCISDLDLGENGTLKDMLLSAKDCKAYANALSWLVQGDLSLSKELQEGTFEEVVDALATALDLVGINPFLKAASLTRNASLLAATPR